MPATRLHYLFILYIQITHQEKMKKMEGTDLDQNVRKFFDIAYSVLNQVI